MNDTGREFALEVQGVSKSFSNNIVLNNINFAVKAGEIHTLLGENGAGKSTLLNIVSGSLAKDSGVIKIKGKEVNLQTPIQARLEGIVKVHQELQVISELSVAENIFLGNEILHPKTKAICMKKMYEEADKILGNLDADFSSKVIVKRLSTAQKQLVEIARALLLEFSVLILDEPTSSLTNKEIEKLFSVMNNLKKQGKAIIFVSHRLEEVFQISDRITVLRDGNSVGVLDIAEATKEHLVQMMTGRDLGNIIQNDHKVDKSDVILSVEDFCSLDGRFNHISFELHRGEILGIAGLVGSGRTEIVRAIFGADRKKSGKLSLDGNPIVIRSPIDSVNHGIALIPEDRKLQGMVGLLKNMNNIGISSYNKLCRHGVLKDKEILQNSKRFMEILNVHPDNPFMQTGRLSGGNQQKVVIAKWLSVDAKIMIMDEPTRGIDVGAKNEIYQLMLQMIEKGVSIIMISSELPEILSLSNRILVIHEGKINGELTREEATEEKVLHYAMGGA